MYRWFRGSVSLFSLTLLLQLIFSVLPLWAQQEKLPDYTLSVPADQGHREYLGLTRENGEFALSDIDADVLLIELFSMYCPYCQQEAPLINILYDKMNNVTENGTAVKIIGLGANNSDFEVNHFRTTFDVQFPLFPDPDMTMYKGLKGEGTPGFIGSRKEADGSWTVVLRQSGGFYDPGDFLNELLEKSGHN